MNKFLKLPLFLASVGGICTAVLATTYELTNPIKVARETEARNAAFKEILKGFDLLDEEGNVIAGVVSDEYKVDSEKPEFELATSLSSKGYSRKVMISQDSKLVGAFYEGSVAGYGGPINFQLSFKDGACYSFVCLSNSETPGFGQDLLAKIPEMIQGKPVSYFKASALDTDFGSGCTVTETYLVPAIAAAAKDYSAASK